MHAVQSRAALTYSAMHEQEVNAAQVLFSTASVFCVRVSVCLRKD